MKQRFDQIGNRRRIIDRRLLADELAALAAEEPDAKRLREAATGILRTALAAGRAEIKERMRANPGRGREFAASYAFLTDQLLRLIHDHVTATQAPLAEPLTLCAVGGYGRVEMAPFSDVDVMFLTGSRPSDQCRRTIERILYLLWDLRLTVGHATRSTSEMLSVAQSDLTVRTALLEMRYVWGDQLLYDEAVRRFESEIVARTARQFVTDKLAERDERHQRMGDSRYVVEPNLKEGKGGLRDLHTLFWIGKYVHQVHQVADLVAVGLLTPLELRQFLKAEDFLWAVRCNLHDIVGRADERLTFDVQRDLAQRLRYADRRGLSGVERFMRHYFLVAKQVGDLTGLFLAHLEETFAGRPWKPRISRRPDRLRSFVVEKGRIGVPSDSFFRSDPVRLLELFHLADLHALEIHPLAMRQVNRDAGLITAAVRQDPRANQLFLDVLTSPRNPELVLRWMNEAGVFGRFVPDFARVVAQMQYDMYHHYTVDEHTIRAIGLVSRLESGALADDHPVASKIVHEISSRRVLYVAVLLHDIAKGRGGDHSELGAEIAQKLCPRLGLTSAETETVAWLVRYHLLMSATAFKRDLTDYKTILNFAEAVQSPERLRLLMLLTVVDIRAVGPGIWNKWKGQLLRDLFHAADDVLRPGQKVDTRQPRILERQATLKRTLGWDDARFQAYADRLLPSYWLSETPEALAINARLIGSTGGDEKLGIATTVDPDSDATLVSIYAADHPGLFYRIAGAISLAGANIVGARIHTTRDGMAVDNLVVQDPLGGSFDDPDRIERLRRSIDTALRTRGRFHDQLASRRYPRMRAGSFKVEPIAFIDNHASNRYTVIEVNALDRPGLLYSLTYALFQSRVTIHSAHVATYGERAVDVFYVTDLTGNQINEPARLRALQQKLVAAAREIGAEVKAAA